MSERFEQVGLVHLPPESRADIASARLVYRAVLQQHRDAAPEGACRHPNLDGTTLPSQSIVSAGTGAKAFNRVDPRSGQAPIIGVNVRSYCSERCSVEDCKAQLKFLVCTRVAASAPVSASSGEGSGRGCYIWFTILQNACYFLSLCVAERAWHCAHNSFSAAAPTSTSKFFVVVRSSSAAALVLTTFAGPDLASGTAAVAPQPVLPSCPLPYGEVVSCTPACMIVRLVEKDSDAIFDSFVTIGGEDYAELHVPNNFGPRRAHIREIPSGSSPYF